MYKMIIADDEILVQIGIKNLLNWQEEEIELAGMAANGQKAYELIRDKQVDIVITDIKMPVMDGIELMKQCNETLDYVPQFILLTNFEEFELAREAIRYGVVEYLVKMDINEETVLAAVRSAKNKADMRRKPAYETKQGLNREELEKLFKQSVNRLLKSDEVRKEAERIDCRMLEPLCLLHFDIIMKNSGNMIRAEEEHVCKCVEDTVHEVINEELISWEIPIHANEFFSLIAGNGGRKEALICMKLREMMQRIMKMTEEYFNVSLKIGCSSFNRPVEELPELYDEAGQALRYVRNENEMFFFQDIEARKEKKQFNIALFTKDIMETWNRHDCDGMKRIFLEIITLFKEAEAESDQIKDCCFRFLYFVLTFIENGEEMINTTIRGNSSGFDYISRLENREEMIQWLLRLCDVLCDNMNMQDAEYSQRIVEHAKKIVRERLGERLMLAGVAEELHVNASYLSMIFKKYEHTGFSDYVNRKKIEASTVLLNSGDYKIYEVAEMMGYENAYYFSRVFKRYMKLTPKEYTANSIKQ
ncbi:response regulator transcription factor [Hungatella hathewayi]|uniref:response regulator transcription factor n=1 Tax=Hungatella hathewayi TaxID=154046 RepID=UPI0035621A61